ncbi:MAG: acetate/propionate family kinase [Salinisphaera sp.]|nr:acetate/propionate family kinase [Salinisphaera sp.]
MSSSNARILTVNGGSSSIRFALYDTDADMQPGLHGKIDRIGLDGTQLTYADPAGETFGHVDIPVTNHKSSASFLIDWLDNQNALESLQAVGHRIVHGMQHTVPEPITPALLDELYRIAIFVPQHLPHEIELIEAFRERVLTLGQAACFDTAFHAALPRCAAILPIPRRYQNHGIRRYGFHGLSYGYLLEELERLGDSAATSGRVILAHLGNGASMAAVRDGQSIDTSMGFTPASGLPMSTRCGDLDPGMADYLARSEGMSTARFEAMANHESGLLGISELSSDVRDLLAQEQCDTRAAEALAVFCYQAKKWIGAFAASLGGVDTVVFSGGIGENSAAIRERICRGLDFLGIEIDSMRDHADSTIISPDLARVTVRVIPTNEERMLARSTARVFGLYPA